MQHAQVRLRAGAHDVAQAHVIEQLAAIAIRLKELLVAKYLIGELAARERAVTEPRTA